MTSVSSPPCSSGLVIFFCQSRYRSKILTFYFYFYFFFLPIFLLGRRTFISLADLFITLLFKCFLAPFFFSKPPFSSPYFMFFCLLFGRLWNAKNEGRRQSQSDIRRSLDFLLNFFSTMIVEDTVTTKRKSFKNSWKCGDPPLNH